MRSPSKCQIMARQITAIFRKGITVKKDVDDYINSTFLNPDLDELESILQDEANCERESLLELIFFPDESMQAVLESFLTKMRFHPRDEEAVLERIMAGRPRVALHFPHTQAAIKVGLPIGIARQFVLRLNMTKKWDPKISQALKAAVSGPEATRLKVKLRNTRFDQTRKRTEFLCALIQKADRLEPDFSECFEFALKFLDQLKDDPDMYDALMRLKNFYAKHFQTAVKFEKLLAQYNLETLRHQGFHIPAMNRSEAFRSMQMVDQICIAVFGKTDYAASLIEMESDQTVEIKIQAK